MRVKIDNTCNGIQLRYQQNQTLHPNANCACAESKAIAMQNEKVANETETENLHEVQREGEEDVGG